MSQSPVLHVFAEFGVHFCVSRSAGHGHLSVSEMVAGESGTRSRVTPEEDRGAESACPFGPENAPHALPGPASLRRLTPGETKTGDASST